MDADVIDHFLLRKKAQVEHREGKGNVRLHVSSAGVTKISVQERAIGTLKEKKKKRGSS